MRKAFAEILLAALAFAGLGACDADEVTHYRVAKAQPPAAAMALPAGMSGDVAAEARPPARGGLKWTLPAGWTETRGGPMRFASFQPPVPGKIDGSVVVLPGPAGGELANVNRWRGQIGLGPIDGAALAKARKIVKAKAGPIDVYDFSSSGEPASRVIAGLTEIDGQTWFVKLSGDAAAVGAARNDFLKLLGSLRIE